MRFINADPIGFSGGMNWYSYAGNSPLMFVDIGGLCPSSRDTDPTDPNSIWGSYNYSSSGREAFAPATSYHPFVEGVIGALKFIKHTLAPVSNMMSYNLIRGRRIYAPNPDPGLQRDFRFLSPEAKGARIASLGMSAIPVSRVPSIIGMAKPAMQGTKVFRVWGGGASATGRSWTTVDPRAVSNYRNAAGLPRQNTGRFLSEGVINDTQGIIIKTAEPLHGNTGGLPEIIIPKPGHVTLYNVMGLNPQF
jgi:hypothetical protein